MLIQLSIQNFALIDHVVIDFKNNLSVITGETGAGKSILLGALGLILGKRAEHSNLKDQTQKCIVEGTFSIADYKLESFFEKNDLDYAASTIIRREINKQGKSRSFINDTPTTLEVMKQLGSKLIDIHSQQQSTLINDENFQLTCIDSLAGNRSFLEKYKVHFEQFKRLCREINTLKERAQEARKQEDYLNFQFQELELLNLVKGELYDLEQEQRLFANSEEIIRNISQVRSIVGEEEGNLLDRLNEVKQLLGNTERFDSSLEEMHSRVSSLLIELQDVNNDIERKAEELTYDPERHEFVEERLGDIYRLQQKHQLSEADDLIELKEELEEKLGNILSFELEIEKLEKQLIVEEEKLTEVANTLRERRLKKLANFEKQVEKRLVHLGIPHAKFKVKHLVKEQFTSSGRDQFNFLFTANKGIEPALVSKTASGGELSRLMLSVKEIMADHGQLPTILFDEIDTGVSGDIAEKMGSILSNMGNKRQVIIITHLPQLAAKGKQHYFVYKSVENDRSITQIKTLQEEERVDELAKMLSGKNITKTAINNAKELLTQ